MQSKVSFTVIALDSKGKWIWIEAYEVEVRLGL